MNTFSTFRKDLRLLLRDRGELVPLFLMPLAFIIPISLAFPSDGYNLNADEKPRLPLALYDLVDGKPAPHAQDLLDSLAESYALEWNATQEAIQLAGAQGEAACAASGPACDEAIARGRVRRDERSVGLVVPAGLSAAVDAGERISITLLYNPARSPMDRQLAEGVIQGSTMRLSLENQLFSGFEQFEDLLDVVPAELQAEIRRRTDGVEEAGVTTTQQPALDVVAQKPANARLATSPNTVQQTIPGYTVMFVFFLIGTVTASIQLERNTGMLRRLQHTPARRSAVLGGKTLSALLIGVLQVAAMFAVGYFFFGLQLGNAPLALLLLTVVVVLSAVCIGLAAAAFRIERGINVLLIVGALLAGCAFPVDWLPPVLRTVNLVLPQTWAMAGYQDLLTRGQGLADVLPEIGVLLAMAGVFFVVAVRRFED
jgi:ABC-2 type transport system permease protein